MSNLRQSIRINSDKRTRSRMRTILQQKGKKSIWEKSKLLESKYLQQIRCHTETIPTTQQKKDGLYNKNITYFRQSFNPNDSHILPFLSSLRHLKDYKQQKSLGLTTLQPFQVSSKETANQKVKKNVNDFAANPFRLSKINTRCNGSSGLGTRTNCQFQCTLRLYKNTSNPQQSSFYNTIQPIRYRTVEERHYTLKDLICERQKRLFTLK